METLGCGDAQNGQTRSGTEGRRFPRSDAGFPLRAWDVICTGRRFGYRNVTKSIRMTPPLSPPRTNSAPIDSEDFSEGREYDGVKVTKAKPRMLWLGRFSSIAWANCVTAASKTSVIEQAGSTSRLPQWSPGTRVYLETRCRESQRAGERDRDRLTGSFVAPGWEHINLTGDYVWHSNKRFTQGRFRPLRAPTQQSFWS
jgi:hypothetical protein